MQTFEYQIDAACAGRRLDVFLTEVQGDLSRSYVQKLIGEGRVRANETPAKAHYRIKEGDQITLKVPDPEPLEVVAEPIPLNVVYEDEAMLVIDKPPGRVVHPAPGHTRGTLVNALLHHCRNLPGIGGVERPGIVHRLDKDTSGLMVVAKTDAALASLQQQFEQRRVRKIYLALVRGRLQPERGVIDRPIARHPVHRKKMAAAAGGREAVTEYEVVEHFKGYDLVRLHLKTGRTHQIRVHLASLGHPVLGDALYGGRSPAPPPPRQALHAHRLELLHPLTQKPQHFESPWPEDLAPWLHP